MNLVYFGVSKSDKVQLAEEEHDSIKWFTEDELDKPDYAIWPSAKFYAKEAIKKAQTK